MTAARTWPNGYVSGWCSSPLAADHARCVLEHVDDRNAPGCHCKPCVAPSAPVVDVEPAPADLVALAAAAEWLGDAPEDTDAAAPATEPAAASVTTLPDVVVDTSAPAVADVAAAAYFARLVEVRDLHSAAGRIGSSKVRVSCAHCGRAYPCPTRRLADGEPLEAAS